MPDISSICHMLSLLPLDCLKLSFMQQALLAVLLLTPMTAALGVEVISFRMAFFSDAIGHSAFAGVALGLLLSVDPHWSMPAFGVLVGLAVMAVRRGSALSSDTVIGIVFSAVVAFGLAVVSRQPGMARTMQQFLYGDVLTVSQGEIVCLAVLFVALLIFQIIGYNRLLAAKPTNVTLACPRHQCLPVAIRLFRSAGPGRHVLRLDRGSAAGHGHAHRPGGGRPQLCPDGGRHVLVGPGRGRHVRGSRPAALGTGMDVYGQRRHHDPCGLCLVRPQQRVGPLAPSPPAFVMQES